MRAQHLTINQIIDILPYIWPNVSVTLQFVGEFYMSRSPKTEKLSITIS